jgi:phage tail tape-measure protein
LEQQSISIGSTPKAVRGAPEGGEGERGRVATGGATTAGSGGGGGVGRQEMEMERETDRQTEREREREKVELEIRAARPSSPRARCSREEWGDTGLRVREWLLARVQAAGVGFRV